MTDQRPPASPPTDPAPSWDRLRDRWRFYTTDHAYLRALWSNLYEFAPGAWRSNQPSPRRIARYAQMGITTVLSLRGHMKTQFADLEKAACAKHGLTYIASDAILARKAMPAERYVALIDLMAELQKPFVIHCKSGADRTGFAAALYLLHCEGASLEAAKKMLSLRFIHLKKSKAGLLDHIFEMYEEDIKAQGPIPIRDWFLHHYDLEKARQFKPVWTFL